MRCYGTQITKLENLPLGLTELGYDIMMVTSIDNVNSSEISFTLRGYQAIRRIQKKIKRKIKITNAIKVI